MCIMHQIDLKTKAKKEHIVIIIKTMISLISGEEELLA